jgi:FkbM family methyltransferase
MRNARNTIANGLAWSAERLLTVLSERGYTDDRFWRRCHLLVLRTRGFGGGADLEKGGELAGAEFLKSVVPAAPVIVDVGANEGQFAMAVREVFPDSILHCLEPQSQAFHILKNNFAGSDQVYTHNSAISTATGSATIYADGAGSKLGSLMRRRLDHFGISQQHEETVHTTSLPDFCAENSISHIDILKLDIEGHELDVLRSLSFEFLANNITAIQFEFGGANIDARNYWQDFFYLLRESHSLYRLTPLGVQLIETYEETDEVFVTTNYLAIRRNIKSQL